MALRLSFIYIYIYIYMNSLALHLDVTVLILCSGSTGSHLETFIMDRQEVKDQDNEHKKIIDNRLRPGSTCVFARGWSCRGLPQFEKNFGGL